MNTFSRKNIVRSFWDEHSLDDKDLFSIFVEQVQNEDDFVSFYGYNGYIGVNYFNSLFAIEQFKVSYSIFSPDSSCLNYESFEIPAPCETGFLEEQYLDYTPEGLLKSQNNYYYFKFNFDEREWSHLLNFEIDDQQKKIAELLSEKLKTISKKLYKLSCKVERKLILLNDEESLAKENLRLKDEITNLKFNINRLKHKNEQISKKIKSALE
jgi:hypothetical protein